MRKSTRVVYTTIGLSVWLVTCHEPTDPLHFKERRSRFFPRQCAIHTDCRLVAMPCDACRCDRIAIRGDAVSDFETEAAMIECPSVTPKDCQPCSFAEPVCSAGVCLVEETPWAQPQDGVVISKGGQKLDAKFVSVRRGPESVRFSFSERPLMCQRAKRAILRILFQKSADEWQVAAVWMNGQLWPHETLVTRLAIGDASSGRLPVELELAAMGPHAEKLDVRGTFRARVCAPGIVEEKIE